MVDLMPLAITVPLSVFYLWMFRAMLNNPRLTKSPWTRLGITHEDSSPMDSAVEWTIAFLILSVLAAALYLVTEYRR